MQTEQLILQRLDTISLQLDELARRQRATDELVEEITPIAREAVATAIARLDALDKQGHLAILAELAQVGRRLVDNFTPADIRQLGDAIVGALDLVRDTVRDADHARPMGAFRALRATRDDDVQKGLGLVIDVLRRVGHGVNGADKPVAAGAKLAELLGPRRTRALPAAASRPAAPPPPPDRPVDPDAWTRDAAQVTAREHGVTLDAPRWALIDAARADFATTKASPNIQRLTSVAGVTTKDLYQLFPKAPARTIAKIAGLPKPAGCL